MAKKKDPTPNPALRSSSRLLKMRRYIRTVGIGHLADSNITSIGIGHKISDNEDGLPIRDEGTICLQFTVRAKLSEDDPSAPETVEAMRHLRTKFIPKEVTFQGSQFVTDVIKRDYKPGFRAATIESASDRKVRVDPIQPGISVSHPSGSAGTLGLVVFDRETGQECILSNWHVLHRAAGDLGDVIVQPGPHDDSDTAHNSCGRLLRSHLGQAGDCAVAAIDGRGVERSILDLGVIPTEVVRVDLGDRVVKSGRTTDVTRGIVRRIDVITSIWYAGHGPELIGGFEIGPLDDAAADFEVSMGGDSGSVWLIARDDGSASGLLAGLHFAGESIGNPDEHALACYAHSVFQKLNVALDKPEPDDLPTTRLGYDDEFLGHELPPPGLTAEQRNDSVLVDGKFLIPYTHFSVCMCRSRGLAYFSAWNVHGGRIKLVSRSGINFVRDDRVPDDEQHGNELYRDNKLDRGHIARRAPLCWGSEDEARQANRDSFSYTNIAPQHQAFNRSNLGGIWGRLENGIFEDTKVSDLRISVVGGPIFNDGTDPEHRGVRIPREYWKAIAYRDVDDGDALKVKAYILTQEDLLSDIEALELDPFQIFQVGIEILGERTDLDFGAWAPLDVFEEGPDECAAPELAQQRARRVRRIARG